jgi:hypothetical protein
VSWQSVAGGGEVDEDETAGARAALTLAGLTNSLERTAELEIRMCLKYNFV